MSLVPVHGGLAAPVNRFFPLSKRKQLKAEMGGMPQIRVTDADLATVYRVADGTLSPMTGPMNEAEYNRVLDEQCIVRGEIASEGLHRCRS